MNPKKRKKKRKVDAFLNFLNREIKEVDRRLDQAGIEMSELAFRTLTYKHRNLVWILDEYEKRKA